MYYPIHIPARTRSVFALPRSRKADSSARLGVVFPYVMIVINEGGSNPASPTKFKNKAA